MGNLMIITTIKTGRALGSPIYFFLFRLSLSHTCFSTCIAPRMIVHAPLKNATIFLTECIVQIFSIHFFGCLEIFILILMAADHYVAIRKPLSYTTIRSHQVCGVLVAVAWVGSIVHSSAQIILTMSLLFCGLNVIDQLPYLCDLQPLLQLACTDTSVTNLPLVSNSGAIFTVSFVMLMFSYAIILHSLRNHSAEGRKKALSMCISHIIPSCSLFPACLYTLTWLPLSPWIR